MKIRRVLRIVIAFILLLSFLSLLTSGTFYVAQKYILKTELIKEYSFWEFSLYILGYGASPNVDIGMQLLLGIVGIIMISLLSAFLTVNLFRRAKDVLISERVMIWEKNSDEYFASILIGNKGKHICNVSVAAQLFDCMGETINIENNCYEKPIIIKNHIWRVDFDIKIGSFMHEYFYEKLKGSGFMQLFVLVSFVDTDTGQESIICKEYRFDDIVAVDKENGFIYPENKIRPEVKTDLNSLKSMLWKKLKKVEGDESSREKFYNYICADYVNINLKSAKPIVANGNPCAMKITHKVLLDSEAEVMTVDFDFGKSNENDINPSFVMALIQFLPVQNWVPYYDKHYRLEFDLAASTEVSSIQLEIKDKLKNKILDKALNVSKSAVHYSFNLYELESSEKWMEVHEICFIVFDHNATKPKGAFTISNCKLIKEI